MHQQLHCMKLLAKWQRTERLLSPIAGRQDAVLGRVHQRLRFLCDTRNEPVPHIGDVVSAAARLGAKRLLLCDPASLRMRMQ